MIGQKAATVKFKGGQRRLLFWQMLLSDNVILLTLSRLIIDQFVAVGSQYGIATFTISLHFDMVENFGLVCIVSVWTWISLDVYQ